MTLITAVLMELSKGIGVRGPLFSFVMGPVFSLQDRPVEGQFFSLVAQNSLE